jgi:hypothetical protein
MGIKPKRPLMAACVMEEEFSMFAGKTVLRRTTTLAAVAALALTAVAPSVATAAPHAKGGVTATSDATDISAQRRRVVRSGRGGAAAAAAFAGIVGTGLAIAATQNRRAYYDDYYGGGPVYVAPGPGYYNGGGYAPYGYGPGW